MLLKYDYKVVHHIDVANWSQHLISNQANFTKSRWHVEEEKK